MRGARVCSWLAMLGSASMAACASPDRLTGHPADTVATTPTTPSTPWTPSFPAVPSGAVVYDRASASTFGGAQRFVLFGDGTFSLQFAHRGQGSTDQNSFAYPGVFSRADSVLRFDFKNTVPWTATAVLRHDSLVVEFNDYMRLSDFEDGVYVQASHGSGSLGGRIAFSTWNGFATVIYTMDADGAHLTTVAEGYDPSFSPDGKKIAFWRYDATGGSIFIANADGSGPIGQVASGGHQPTWSPDGQRLAFGCGGICIVNVDGTGWTRLTPAAPVSQDRDVCIRDTDPAWSPDGSTIAFTRWPDERIPTSMCLSLGAALSFPFDFWTEVWLIGVDGSNPRPLRDDAGRVVTYAGWPSWSPDGGRLAFYYVNGQEERIDVANVNRSGFVTAVQRAPVVWDAVLGSPAWSPDGSQIIFGTKGGWGLAESSGSGRITVFSLPNGIVPNSLSWSWAPLSSK